MEIKGLKENEHIKDKSEFIPVKLGFFSWNSLKQAISRLSEMSLNPSPNGLNRKGVRHNLKDHWENIER